MTSRTRTTDYRTRHDRTKNRTTLFEAQMTPLAEAYKMWSSGQAKGMTASHVPAKEDGQTLYSIRVVDIFSKYSLFSLRFS